MPAPRVLFVKLSSLGDVIHHLPAVTDLHARRPEVAVDWAVEEGYAPLVRMHPAVHAAIPVALRRLKAGVLSPSAWGALAGTRRQLAAQPYDWIVDAQGLLKSVAVARLARGPLFGFDRGSIREKAAARFYDVGLSVPRNLHAVERNRRLVGAIFGYTPEGPPDYGLAAPPRAPEWAPQRRYVVALHASSRKEKGWPADRWTDLANHLRSEGIAVVYPGGTDAERRVAARLAAEVDGATVAPPMSLPEAAALLANACAVVGVDTGLTHLSVALGTPTVGLYLATKPGLTGLHGRTGAVNLGGVGNAPTTGEVMQVLLGASFPA
jgi:heptosyltransferase-1